MLTVLQGNSMDNKIESTCSNKDCHSGLSGIKESSDFSDSGQAGMTKSRIIYDKPLLPLSLPRFFGVWELKRGRLPEVPYKTESIFL
jgi:hypothetical protein